MKTLRMLMAYMGRRRALLPLSLLLSALSELAGLVPYVLVWLIVKSLLTSGPVAGGERAVAYAWWAAGIAAAGVVLYFAALTSSHLAAFRVESNLRRSAMRRITAMPLGFFELHPSGRVRKVIDDTPASRTASSPTSCPTSPPPCSCRPLPCSSCSGSTGGWASPASCPSPWPCSSWVTR